ncbi:hypothetical protein ACRN9Z_19575 [Shewanella frigidimarina]|jgi:hypothetical protein|uniref:Uncharacterized protein n=1 Tax=Shewanella frigidimarina (strain NCIMB 400) TaxID=318167 RepID=Q07ZE0_SHEFN|nr:MULTISPECIES: hypothetical protein [Shewanella]MBB1381858.1 hypothetical protein [Shewanella sp. SR41-2]ABI72624.1 hypothetical protein Sfri_2784 [Shewanella frigidimarina NCIMB 400]PKI07125.1 hypothetical protein CXF78_06970 [Shewanella sp. 11B5]RPA38271.1 hypothetical protein EGC78_00360 [Shewanella frigidimarina]RPA63771.1 hypothetical protein EGC86_00375 [Shewanella frigidimarina]
MFNLNTIFAVALTSIMGLSSAQATELEPIDMIDLHAELSQSIEAMQIDINYDVNSILVADNDEQQKTSEAVQAN